MDEKKKETKQNFKTLVKGEDKRSKIDYNIGKIEGLMWALCGRMGEKPKHNTRTPFGIVLEVDGRPSRYARFKEVVEQFWPGLCVFDWGKE